MNVKYAQCRVPGFDDLEVAADGGGHVEQERRKRVGKPVLRGGVGRNGRLRPAELKAAARAAVVLRLQQEVAVVPEVLAELDRVVAGDFREDRGELHRPLGAIPRQARREADERIAEAGDVDLRHAARPLVDVRAADADLLRRRWPWPADTASLW